MEKLYLMAKGHTLRFPSGNDPFRICTRILEECGEVAQQVNQLEKTGAKESKGYLGSRKELANEIRQSVMCLLQLAQYYECEADVEEAIEISLRRLREDGVIE